MPHFAEASNEAEDAVNNTPIPGQIAPTSCESPHCTARSPPRACWAVVLVRIRDAALADMPVLQAVFRRSSLSNEGDRANLLAHPEVLEYSDEWVRLGHTRVATHDGRIRGFATAVPGEEALELEDLFVDPDWMRWGIGRALIGDVVARARRGNVRRVDVTANVHALEFYRAVGFVLGGVADTRFGPAPRMHLEINP